MQNQLGREMHRRVHRRVSREELDAIADARPPCIWVDEILQQELPKDVAFAKKYGFTLRQMLASASLSPLWPHVQYFWAAVKGAEKPMRVVKGTAKLKTWGLGPNWKVVLWQLWAAQPGFTLSPTLREEAEGAPLEWVAICAVLTAHASNVNSCRVALRLCFLAQHMQDLRKLHRADLACATEMSWVASAATSPRSWRSQTSWARHARSWRR